VVHGDCRLGQCLADGAAKLGGHVRRHQFDPVPPPPRPGTDTVPDRLTAAAVHNIQDRPAIQAGEHDRPGLDPGNLAGIIFEIPDPPEAVFINAQAAD
jgi:hypothetical protein